MSVTLNTTVDCSGTKTRTGLFAHVARMIAVGKQRRALKSLDAHLLRDIGITQQKALNEAKKPVWDVPAHWSK